MKTLQELYNEIISSDNLKNEFLSAAQNNEVENFLKSHDCNASLEDVKAFLEDQNKDGELSDDEVENVAGGSCNLKTVNEGALSFATAGIACAAVAAISAGAGHVGQKNDEQGRLCTLKYT